MAVRWIAFHLTDRCQLDCQHCLRDPLRASKDLPIALVRRVLDEAVTRYRVCHVSLTGGEPTLHPDFVQVCDAIVDHGLTWHLVTNGRRAAWLATVLRQRPARKKQLTELNLSLDGSQEATHDRIRGKGSYREVMAAASVAIAEEIPFSFVTTLHAGNEAELEQIGYLAAELGARRVQYGPCVATGTLHDEQLALPVSTWRSLKERIERLRSILRLQVSMAEGFPNDEPFHICKSLRSELLNVDVDGKLNLCCMHSGVPDAGEALDVAADLSETSLLTAHSALLDIIHRAQRKRLDDIGGGQLDAWDSMPCNYCMKIFGKPHWSDAGQSGPSADRARWRTDAQRKARLPILADQSPPPGRGPGIKVGS